MIGDILSDIKDAEERAAKIIETAQVKVAQIESEATEQIRKINAQTEDEVAKISLKKVNKKPIQEKADNIKIEVSQEKLDAAKAFIIAEFSKRFAK